MRYIRLLAVTDEYDDTPGLALKAAPRTYEGFMADRNGDLIAHDIIEHQNGAKNIGSIDDELEASGGVWHVRGRWGDFKNTYHQPAHHAAADISRMFTDQGYWTIPTNGTRLIEDIEEDIDEIIVQSKKLIKAEAYEPSDLDNMDEFLEAARRRIRIGYRKATKRFGTGYESNSIYNNIKRALETCVKHVDYEGQEFVLAYDRREASCRELEISYE